MHRHYVLTNLGQIRDVFIFSHPRDFVVYDYGECTRIEKPLRFACTVANSRKSRGL